jgi:probable HAF family extracellular repeat protein
MLKPVRVVYPGRLFHNRRTRSTRVYRTLHVLGLESSFNEITSFPHRSASCKSCLASTQKGLSVHRLVIVPLVALLICSCNTPDAALGVDGAAEKTLPGGAMARVDLGTLGGASSYAADINSGSTVVGWSETRAGTTHAFRWSAAEGMVDLGTLPGDAMSRAVAVLDAGTQGGRQILGMSGDDGRWTPVVWSASGSISALPIPLIPSFTIALPMGFNARGDVVGSDAGGFQHGWVWSETHGKYDLSANIQGGSNEGSASAVTASGLVVLTSMASTCKRTIECWRTYLWTRTTGYRPLGTPGGDSEANVTGLALNETGTVAGWVTSGATGGTIPYRWTAATGFTLLANYSTESSPFGYATAVSSTGIVVGADFEPASGSIVASTWLANGAIVRLSPDDPNPSVAVAVSRLGTIAGWAAVSNGVNHAVIWKPSSQASPVVMRVPTSVTARASTASAPCLADPRSISSRQALFACVANADRKR